MATNKTIAPTGATVQIPALTDTPDMSVPANAIDKTIDAVNELHSRTTYVDNETNKFKAFWVSVQADGRVQLSPRTNNGQTVRVVTFGENGRAEEAKSLDGGSSWSTLWSGNLGHITPYYRSRANAASFNIDIVSGNSSSSYRLAILFQHESGHPAMHLISIGTGTSPTVTALKVFGDANSRSPSSVSMSGDTLTINYSNTVYGGISLLWLD